MSVALTGIQHRDNTMHIQISLKRIHVFFIKSLVNGFVVLVRQNIIVYNICGIISLFISGVNAGGYER